jgi:hypothetical protein
MKPLFLLHLLDLSAIDFIGGRYVTLLMGEPNRGRKMKQDLCASDSDIKALLLRETVTVEELRDRVVQHFSPRPPRIWLDGVVTASSPKALSVARSPSVAGRSRPLKKQT